MTDRRARSEGNRRGRERPEDRLARLVVGQALRVKRGESVTVEAWSHALPWATACVREIVQRGAQPMILYNDDPTYWGLVGAGRTRELGTLGDHERAALAKTDAYIYFEGPEDRGRLHALDDSTRRTLFGWEDAWWSTAKKGGLRCAWVLLGRAVASSARFHGIPLARWRSELVQASLVDPAGMQRDGARLAKRLAGGRTLLIRHPNGTRLELRLRGRVPIVHDGIIDRRDLSNGHFLEEIPSGYIPVAVDERYAEGTILSNVASHAMDGHTVVSGARWTFKDGRLVRFDHARGGEHLAREYAAAPEDGRDRPAVISIGLNPAIRSAPIVSDQRKGRLMFMVGGNSSHGGSNANPFHAYLLLDGATVEVDGRPILRAGRIG